MSSEKQSEQNKKASFPVLSFVTPDEWRHWLDENYDTVKGVWLKFYKKGSGIPSLNYAGALDEALCYGWIDGQSKSLDEISYLQKFTPRRAKSIWSKRNVEYIGRLLKEGKMKPPGLNEFDNAKKDGRLDNAYDSPANMTLPTDFLERLSHDKKARSFFESLNKANLYAIGWRLQTAKKPQTREKRMKIILEMLSKGEKFH